MGTKNKLLTAYRIAYPEPLLITISYDVTSDVIKWKDKWPVHFLRAFDAPYSSVVFPLKFIYLLIKQPLLFYPTGYLQHSTNLSVSVSFNAYVLCCNLSLKFFIH